MLYSFHLWCAKNWGFLNCTSIGSKKVSAKSPKINNFQVSSLAWDHEVVFLPLLPPCQTRANSSRDLQRWLWTCWGGGKLVNSDLGSIVTDNIMQSNFDFGRCEYFETVVLKSVMFNLINTQLSVHFSGGFEQIGAVWAFLLGNQPET